jgi:cyclophilin family peptidyl-prolyl cis-trans isomerase
MGQRLPLTALALTALAVSACGSSHAKHTATTGTGNAARTCQNVAAPGPRGPQHLAKPQLKLNPNRSYTVRLNTNCGEIDISLGVAEAPKTTASFASLVRRHFYDGLTFHRIVPGFVIQGGDPAGNGSGGPGYRVVEKPPSNAKYTRGVVAMAKTATEASGTSGSQFFIVTAADAQLPPDYAVAGNVIKGDGVLSRIAATPTGAGPNGEQPQLPVVIEKATLVVQ